jgi:D-alanine--poly(phosphoribitol) ligase subunit 2
MSTADQVLAVIEAVTREPAVRTTPDLALFEHHVLDSLRTIELVLALGDAFGADLAVSEVDREAWATPERIVAFMEQRVGR